MKTPVYFPIYNIHSDLVKTALGLRDNRSIEKFMETAGVPIKLIGNKQCVFCEDLFNVIDSKSRSRLGAYDESDDYHKSLEKYD